MGSLEIPEETFLRFVRLVKSGGLKAKPHFQVKFNESDIPKGGDRAYGAYIPPVPRSFGKDILYLSLAYLGIVADAIFWNLHCTRKKEVIKSIYNK